MDRLIQDPAPHAPLPPAPTASARPALSGLRWLQGGFALFIAQPSRWVMVLGIWLALSLIVPTVVTVALEDIRKAVVIALTPLGLQDLFGGFLQMMIVLVPLGMILLFPVVFAGLMVGAALVSSGEKLRAKHLFAAFFRDPGRFVTVGGINAVGQLMISEAVAWFIHDRMADIDFSFSETVSVAQNLALLMDKLSHLTPLVLPVLLLQTCLMAALWFTPPLLVFHQMTALQAVRASLQACGRNIAALLLYSVAVILMLSVVGAVSFSASSGVLLALVALVVLAAAMTTVIASLYVSYKEIFQV